MDLDLRARALAALAAFPVVDLDIVDPADRATWRLGFSDQASDAQRQAALAALAAWKDMRFATVEQILNAVDDLGLSAAWTTAEGKVKPAVRAYLAAHYALPVPETNGKLAKIIGALAPPTNGSALTVSGLFDRAVTE